MLLFDHRQEEEFDDWNMDGLGTKLDTYMNIGRWFNA